ncbi:hypothetical protein Tco_1455147 [Tanacetum coccineum]
MSTPPRQQTPPTSPPSPPRSTQAGYTSRGAENLITLTGVSSVVSTLVQKVNSLETELKDTKKLFKDMVGKLVKKVKAIEVKLKTKKKEAVSVDSNIPPGGASNTPAASSHIPTDVPTGGDFSLAHSTSPSKDPFKGKGCNLCKEVGTRGRDVCFSEEDQTSRGLSSELLGAYVNDDNFSERMVALINHRKRAFVEQMAKEKRDKLMTPAQQMEYMRVFVKNQSTTIYSTDIKSNELKKTLKRAGEALESDISKKQKSTEAPTPFVPDVPQPPIVSSPKSSGTRRKSLGRMISTSLGEINALYRMDQSTKHFTTLREILRMVDRHDLLKLYGMVVKYYENHPVDGAGLISWKLYTLSNVHVLETVSGEVLYMFADVSYPLSVKLIERMLKHKLEIAKDVVGNDMTTAEQLIRFIKN